MRIPLLSLAAVAVLSFVVACPGGGASEGEGDEGEGDVAEGEGDEGEGDEGEGDVGEGEGDVGEGEGEGDVTGEGEGEGEGDVVSGCGAPVDIPNDDPFSYPLTVQAAGRTREYGVHFPPNYDPNHAYPVVFFFHGDTNLNQLPKGPEGRGFFAEEDKLGTDAILVYIDAENLNLAGRNDGEDQSQFFSWDAATLPPANPDLAFIDAVRVELESDYCVDASKYFAIGFSGGGFFVHSLACYDGDLAAFAVYEGGFEDGSLAPEVIVDTDDCVGAAVPSILVHTPNDTTVPESYGTIARDFWTANNGCAATSTESVLDAECQEFDGCDADVVYCRPECTNDGNGLDAGCGAADQHTVWQPEGPGVVATFFRRFF